MSGDFDWNETESVIVPEQAATAVYFNNAGQIVIRQKGDPYDDEDHWFLFAPANAAILARRILEMVAYEDGRQTARQLYDGDDHADSKNTNAERQRRYRVRHRNGVTPTVTDDRNADTVTLPIAAE